MDKFRGITEKVSEDGSKAIYVRFQYEGKIYGVKNFTKLFGVTTKTNAYKKLSEIKTLLSQGIDPFNREGKKLDDYFYRRIISQRKSGEWRENTIDQYKEFYENHIKKSIGHKKLDKIKYKDLDNIMKTIAHTKGSYKNRVSRLLSPIFKEGIKREEININPCDSIDFVEVGEKQKISSRVKGEKLVIARTLYKAFSEHKARYHNQKDEINVFFLLVLLTGHRYGELLKLTKDDCYLDEKKIISPSHITKTKKEYEFPIPKECIKWIENKFDGELLFPNMNYDSIYYQFQNILKKTDIELYNNKKLSPHDLRSLLLNIMRKNCNIDTMLADSCLDHSVPNSLKHYIDFDYDDRKKAFKKYWKKIRKDYK